MRYWSWYILYGKVLRDLKSSRTFFWSSTKYDAGAGKFAICLLRRPHAVLGHPHQASHAREETKLHQHYVRQCLLLRGYTRIPHDSKLLQSRRVKLDRRNSPQGTVDWHLWKMVRRKMRQLTSLTRMFWIDCLEYSVIFTFKFN